MDLRCNDNQLGPVPSIDELHGALHNLLNDIANIAQELPTLESWIDVKTPNQFISVVVPEWYLEQSHRRLTEIFTEKFKPLQTYLNVLQEQFGVVYDVKTHDDIVAYVAEEHSFEECLAKLEDFHRFIREINGMVNFPVLFIYLFY